MISWLIDEAPDNEKRDVRELTKRVLLLNFAAIHTSSNVSSESRVNYPFSATKFRVFTLGPHASHFPASRRASVASRRRSTRGYWFPGADYQRRHWRGERRQNRFNSEGQRHYWCYGLKRFMFFLLMNFGFIRLDTITDVHDLMTTTVQLSDNLLFFFNRLIISFCRNGTWG